MEKLLITEKGLDLLPISSINLTRPFRFSDLVEALHLIIEQLKSKRENKKTFGHISFMILDRKLIYKDNFSVELTEKESDIIVSLLNSAGRGITKEAVMSKVWMLNKKMETHTFETHLYRLRKKIKENLFLKNLIMNKGGKYYLNPELTGQEN
jgi:DNA-binding response OmpR family regulator